MKCPFLMGKKIYLRALERSDLNKGYLDWLNDRKVNRFLMSGTFPTTLSKLEDYYEKIVVSPNDVIFAIALKKTGRHIGNIKIGGIDWVNRSAHCGRLIGEKRDWGKGYGTEAMRLIMDYAFSTLNLNRLYNLIVAGNKGAIKSCEKLGMKNEGVFSQFRFLEGRYHDVIQMAITRDRYQNIIGKR